MIRTRDIILYVLVVWFLLIAISVTVWRDAEEVGDSSTIQFTDSASTASTVERTAVLSGRESAEPDRAATIDRLRAKIAAGNVITNASPSVLTAETSTTDDSAPEPVLQRCAAPDDSLGFVSTWPVLSIQSELQEGARVFYAEETVPARPANTASSTDAEPETIRTTWLQLPQFPQPLATPACVPSEVIGVHTNGTLLFNADALSYRNLGANTLVGYARDGYPIYGLYDGEVDACGGYQHPTGYRYTIHADSDTFIQCFTAAPQQIQW